MAKRFREPTRENFDEAASGLIARERPVVSSAIRSVLYDFIDDTVQINFTDGSSYIYYGVDIDVYMGLMRSKSKGEYFNANIRNNYSYMQV